MYKNQNIFYQIFSFKNGLELIITFLAVSQSLYLFNRNRHKKNKVLFLHASFLAVLGLHFIYLNINNIFNIKISIISSFFHSLYGPLVYFKVMLLTNKLKLPRKGLVIYVVLGIVSSFICYFLYDQHKLMLSLLYHSYINVFLSISLFILFKSKNEIGSLKYTWSASFVLIFLVTNTIFIIVPYLKLYSDFEIYLSFKFPVILLFILLLLNNARTLLLNNKLLNTMLNDRGEVNKNFYLQVASEIEKIMLNKELFLIPNLKLKDFSDETGFSEKELSSTFNNILKSGFYDYVNNFRINRTIDIIKEDVCKEKLIKEIMYDSGFGNKVTFNKVFKDKLGCTPSQYRSQLNIKVIN